MTGEEFFALLLRHQELIREHLSADEYSAFVGHLVRLQAAPDAREARAILLALKRLLDPLPMDPIGNALDDFRTDTGVAEAAPSPQLLADLIDIMQAALHSANESEPDESGLGFADEYRLSAQAQAVFDQVRRRLLEAPMLRRWELPADLAADPVGAGLIELHDLHGGECYPAFQFDATAGRPRPVVLRINASLHADRDPWSAADWWLGGNTWLGAAPAAMLATGSADALEQAARARLEAD